MGIEAATYITDLVAANPGAADLRSQGDDHLRLLKAVLQTTFPTASKAWYNPTTLFKNANFTVVVADMNKTFLVDTAGGGIDMTLPTLGAGDAGWECFMVKTSFSSVNPVLIKPASGTLSSGAISGMAAARRSIPGVRIQCLWSGTAWLISRACQVPVGCMIDTSGVSLPVGYEWPNGVNVGLAANYPEYVSIVGGVGTFDLRGRLCIPLDNLGGIGAAGRITGGTVFGATGGAETVALTTANLASHTHTGTTDTQSANHTHNYTSPSGSNTTTGGGGFTVFNGGAAAFTNATGTESANHTHTFTSNASGSGTAHSNLQPYIVFPKILVVE